MTTDGNSLDLHDASNPMGRRAMLGRMAAGGALLWASPLITSTASAQTTGTCLQSGTLRWNQGVWNTWPSGNGQTRTGEIESTGVIATVRTTLVNTSPAIGQYTVTDHTRYSNGGQSYIEFGQQSSGRTNWNQGHRTVRIDFGTELTNVQFNIRDIDRESSNSNPTWDDRVAVTSNGAVSRTLTSDLEGAGTGTGNNQAVRRTNVSNLSFPNSNEGRANFTVSGSPTWIEIHYWNGDRNNGSNILQQIFLSEISFGCA